MRVILCALALIAMPGLAFESLATGNAVQALVAVLAFGAAAMGLWTQYQRTFRR